MARPRLHHQAWPAQDERSLVGSRRPPSVAPGAVRQGQRPAAPRWPTSTPPPGGPRPRRARTGARRQRRCRLPQGARQGTAKARISRGSHGQFRAQAARVSATRTVFAPARSGRRTSNRSGSRQNRSIRVRPIEAVAPRWTRPAPHRRPRPARSKHIGRRQQMKRRPPRTPVEPVETGRVARRRIAELSFTWKRRLERALGDVGPFWTCTLTSSRNIPE